MSTEIDRFFSDLRTNTELQSEARSINDVADLASFANAHGYTMTAAECVEYDAAHSELTDEELDSVAGGFSLVTSSAIYN